MSKEATDLQTVRPVRYRLYIDESGDHVYNLLDQADHRYLALLGVWFRQQEDYLPFAEKMSQFKDSIFGPRPDKPVVFHRSDILNKKGPFGILQDPVKQADFDRGLLRLIEETQFTLIVVAIDKKEHLEKYVYPEHPYHYCLQAILDRYSGYLNGKNAVGDVCAEARGAADDRQLQAAYRKVYEAGTHMFDWRHHQRALTSKEIKIIRSERNVPGLQLADLLAHPVKQAMLRKKGLVSSQPTPFAEALVEIARKKANRKEYHGRVDGYGAVWL